MDFETIERFQVNELLFLTYWGGVSLQMFRNNGNDKRFYL